MSPAVKYTLGRLGLFVVVYVLLVPVPLNFLVRAMVALLASATFSYFLLAKWRNEMAEQLGTVAERRQAEKQRLRAALAGDEAAAAEGDRASAPGDDTVSATSARAATAAASATADARAAAGADRRAVADADRRAAAGADKDDSKRS